MKKIFLIILIAISASCFGREPGNRDSSFMERMEKARNYPYGYYFGGNWTTTGTKNQWGNGMSFSSKSEAQLSAFTNQSDSVLVQWRRLDSTLAVRYSVG